jgi:hypothetical protein
MSDTVKKYSSDSKTIARRERVIERLQTQLKRNVKPVKGSLDKTAQLTPKDVERIQKELDILKTRLM